MLHGETIHSALPQDIPWWMPDHAIFFGVLYAILLCVGTGVGIVILRSVLESIKESKNEQNELCK